MNLHFPLILTIITSLISLSCSEPPIGDEKISEFSECKNDRSLRDTKYIQTDKDGIEKSYCGEQVKYYNFGWYSEDVVLIIEGKFIKSYVTNSGWPDSYKNFDGSFNLEKIDELPESHSSISITQDDSVSDGAENESCCISITSIKTTNETTFISLFWNYASIENEKWASVAADTVEIELKTSPDGSLEITSWESTP